MTTHNHLTFPEGFIWGAASSAYQVEGAVNEDGRGVSIWDTFTHTPGKIRHGHNGDVAADHYHRWEEDLDLMAGLGLKAYRFSIAWPRILPQGVGAVNTRGLDFYDRLVDGILARGMQPFPTLYHWDLPQALHDQGSWPARAIPEAFGEYARVLGERLGDRVCYWITHNEPMVMALGGYFTGELAPGIQDLGAAFTTGLHLLLSHGLAVQALRSTSRTNARVGITLNLSPVYPASRKEEDVQAAARYDAVTNRMFLDPVLRGRLPELMQDALGMLSSPITPQDFQTMSVPIDFLGINYYSRALVQYDESFPVIQANTVQPQGNEYSMMWEIYPPGIYDLLTGIWKDYGDIPGLRLMVTENGICVPDGVDFDGRVRDERRIRYLHKHIAQVQRAIIAGVPVDGYFVWSPTDNFEWAYGYDMRFGLIYIDFETQTRTVKDSGHWYAQVIAQNGVEEI